MVLFGENRDSEIGLSCQIVLAMLIQFYFLHIILIYIAAYYTYNFIHIDAGYLPEVAQ